MTCNKNNKSVETKLQLAQILELADKDIKTVITAFHIFKKLTTDIEDTFESPKSNLQS